MNRKEAIAAGAKTYEGVSCKHGHPPVRYTSNRLCKECNQVKSNKYYQDTGRLVSAARHRRVKYGLDGPAFAALLS